MPNRHTHTHTHRHIHTHTGTRTHTTPLNLRRVSDLEGARAIVLSGGYKDDADHGSTMWYTGQGGQKNKQQVCDGRGVCGEWGVSD